MTSYCGKLKVAKKIWEIISEVEDNIREEYPKAIEINRSLEYNKYVEPFCGMMSVGLQFVSHQPDRKIYISDLNPDITTYWKKLQKGWSPPTRLNEKKFNQLKQSTTPSAERAFVASTFSFGGDYFGSYCGKYESDETVKKYLKHVRDYVLDVQDILFDANVKVYSAQDYKSLGKSSQCNKR